MPAPAFTPVLKSSYQRLFDTCSITPNKYVFIDKSVNKIAVNKARYEAVGSKLGIPWYFIGIVHNMEGNSDFTRHLHNGDPLTAPTVNVPANRPKGTPPFAWEISAEDALRYTRMDKWKDWSIPGVLYKLEGYNGYGYRKLAQPINTPYLWSFSNQYTSGKYVADGKYSPTAISQQCGAATILKRMAEKQLLDFQVTDRLAALKELGESIPFAPAKYNAKAEELQKQLNLNGAHLREDGKAGQFTSDAYFALTGKYLNGDARRVV